MDLPIDIVRTDADAAGGIDERDPVFAGLTGTQVDAVRHVDGALLVLAGPGSGKTTVVTRRVAHLLRQGVAPWRILALTFTNKAAGEMRERIAALVPPELGVARGLTVATFHAFCIRQLRKYAPEADLPPSFTLMDAADARAAVKQAIKDADLAERNFTPGSVAAEISDLKNRLIDPERALAEAHDFFSRAIANAYASYQGLLRRTGAVDFDDLLMKMALLLRREGAAREELQRRYRYLLVDEYQDTNHAQFVIAKAIAEGSGNICVVGDPDQSIYAWRGADISNILDFEATWPDATVVPLGRNFRSTGHLVAAADALIRHNRRRKHKPLSTELDEGLRPQVLETTDERHEAQEIVDRFVRLNADLDDSVPWREMAVLYRVNALSRVLEDAFRRRGIPYVVARGTAFYERKEVKDLLAYLRLVLNPADDISFRRIVNEPARGIGKTSLDRLEAAARAWEVPMLDAARHAEEVPSMTARAAKSIGAFAAMVDGWRAAAADWRDGTSADAGEFLADLINRIADDSGLREALATAVHESDRERALNLDELASAASEFEPVPDIEVEEALAIAEEGAGDGAPPPEIRWDGPAVIAAFLEQVTLVSDADAVDPESGAVTLMTLHAAKGLEFHAVAIAGLEHGLLPHGRSIGDDDEMEEERRLLFVGMTRAKRALLLTHARTRAIRGISERTIASTFLDELPAEHVVREDARDAFDPFLEVAGGDEIERVSGGGRAIAGARGGAGGIARGVYVQHAAFGPGKVESVAHRPAGSTARIYFRDHGVKTIHLDDTELDVIDEQDVFTD